MTFCDSAHLRGYIRCLTIGGSDPTSGAGVYADLATFRSFGLDGGAVVTAVTAQNSRGLRSLSCLSPVCVNDQFMSVCDEHDILSLKIGMMGSLDILLTVSRLLDSFKIPVVLDTVLFASSGGSLYDGGRDGGLEEYVSALRSLIIPRVSLLTPNVYEASIICNITEAEVCNCHEKVANCLLSLGCDAVFLKGGHLSGDFCEDFYFTKLTSFSLSSPRVCSPHTHGSGCVLSSAICADIAEQRLYSMGGDFNLEKSVRRGKHFVTKAIERAESEYGGGPYSGVSYCAVRQPDPYP